MPRVPCRCTQTSLRGNIAPRPGLPGSTAGNRPPGTQPGSAAVVVVVRGTRLWPGVADPVDRPRDVVADIEGAVRADDDVHRIPPEVAAGVDPVDGEVTHALLLLAGDHREED